MTTARQATARPSSSFSDHEVAEATMPEKKNEAEDGARDD
jgi:hypothetical protein